MFSAAEMDDFERMYHEAVAVNGIVNYQSKFPKHRFIDYLTEFKNVVAHGSNNSKIETFETRQQTLFSGKSVEAIFAAKDGIWPIFYAILDRNKVVYNFRNGCFKTKNKRRFYFFSITQQTLDNEPWTTGYVYLLPSESFERASYTRVYVDEWISKQEVKPLLKMEVSPSDFEYHNKVSIHRPRESILMTWLLYKIRTSKRDHSKKAD